ncbi:MAG: hypothetical protein RMK29_20950 [Myxococcales bacterium]|nr:hypothetical protein [Myxococcota bacterium]MDW8284182.1 hypothetical protein [Myxococcales bacterium]
MSRFWPPFGFVSVVPAALALAACATAQEPNAEGDMAMPDLAMPDLAATCQADPLPQVDFAVPPTGQQVQPGNIGTPCNTNADCRQGTSPVCWQRTLFNQMGLLETPGGYCSSTCNTDADCCNGRADCEHLCLDFGMRFGKACIAGCRDAVTCRHPGYSCAYLSVVNNNILTGCWPNGNLTCNPKEPECTDPRYGQPGACWRQAIEDQRGGICLQLCQVGEPCDPSIFDEPLQCLYIDFTQEGDAFRGTMCFPGVEMPKDPGATCRFSNECTDGYQCDNRMNGGSRVCEKMCNLKGRNPRCPTGQVCTKVFPSCEAGLCKPQ